VLIAQLGIEQPPPVLGAVPDLGHHVVHREPGDEVGGEADARANGDALVPGQGDEEEGEIAAAADKPLYRRPRRGQRLRRQLVQAAQHRVGVAGIDLGEPLGWNTLADGVLGPIVDDQVAGEPAQAVKVAGKIDQPPRHLAGIGDVALGRVVGERIHDDGTSC